MGAASVVERVRAIAERVAAGAGLDVFDVQFRREAPGWVVRVLLDRPGPAATAEESVSIADCEHVSRELATILDVEDVVDREYTLEVSSPGLDRPLRRVEDYRRFAGRMARLVLTAPVDGQTFVKGRLRGVEDDRVVIEAEGAKLRRVPLSAIGRARLEVEF